MEKELQQALAALISKGASAAEAGAAFLRAEIPDVIRQLLVWKAVEAGILAAALLGIAIGISYGALRAHRWIQADECKYGINGRDPFYILVATAMIGAVGAVIAAFQNAMTVSQITLAPKIYLIEYAASLAQGAAK